MLQRLIDRLRESLASKHALWLVPTITAGLMAFGLDAGWLVDDYVHRAALTEHPSLPDLHRSPDELFKFVDGDPERVGEIVRDGIWPWWSARDLRLAFWRPLTGWSHALDYRLWPESPWMMHLHSLVWHLLSVCLLLIFYRRIIPHPAVAGLAGLLFAIDDSRALPALWLANRNAVIATAFGVACLLAHDRWRRDGWRPGAVMGPLLLLAAVLANEGAVAIGGYLVAYAVFLDPSPWRQRLGALVPSASVGLLWAVAYKAGGYGALGSGVYIDPLGEPIRFATAVVTRAPFLLWGSWGFPPADLSNFLPETVRWQALSLTLAALILFLGLLRPILWREAGARFLGLGMLLALLPACSTFASNRMLGFVGIGATGLLALLIRELASRAGTGRRLGAVGWGRRALLVPLLAIHLLAPPLLSRLYLQQIAGLDTVIGASAVHLTELAPPRGDSLAPQQVIVVATPSAFISLASTVVAAVEHDWHTPITLVLSSSIYGTEVVRKDTKTLVVRPLGGFIRSPTSSAPADIVEGSLDPRRAMLMLDHLFRNLERDPFTVGDRVELAGTTCEILEVEDGRPLAVAFHFSEPLENERWRWLAWHEGRYEPFPLPEVGEVVNWPGLYEPRAPTDQSKPTTRRKPASPSTNS